MPRNSSTRAQRERVSTPRILLITPSLDGHDGLSCLARQVVERLSAIFADSFIDVWVLASSTPAANDRLRVRSANGSRPAIMSWALVEAFDREPADLVIVLHLHLMPLALPLAWRGVAVVPFLIGIEAWRRLRGLRAAALARARTAIAISAYTEREFRRCNPDFGGLNIYICRPATPPLAVAPNAADRTPPFALIVGRLAADERYKGHDLLIDIWPDVQQAIPHAKLVVVGGGDDNARLRKRVSRAGLHEAIVFAGAVDSDSLARFYRECSMLVLPSRGEGFGLVLLEAMAAGRACVAATGAAEEIVVDDVTGLIVNPEKPDSVRDAIVRLFRDPALRARLGAAGQGRASIEFGVARFERDLASILCPLLPAVTATSLC
jgi:glycosyltransferase involved in cell wall biosynthesis